MLSSESRGYGTPSLTQKKKVVMKLRIHHVSDVHVGSGHYNPSNRLKVGHVDEQCANLKKYCDYIEGCECKALPDLIVISGDITSEGTENEFAVAKKYLLQIASLIVESRKKQVAVFIVPGNHDLIREHDDYCRRVKNYAHFAKSLKEEAKCPIFSPLYEDLKENTNNYDDNINSISVSMALMNTTSYSGIKDPKLRDLAKAYEGLNCSKGGASCPIAEIAKSKSSKRIDFGYIDDDEFRKLTNFGHSDVNIVTMHHNLTSVPTEDLLDFDATINAGIVKHRLSIAGANLILHGHRHCTHIVKETYYNVDGDRDLLIAGADSIGEKAGSFLDIEICKRAVFESSKPSLSINITERFVSDTAAKCLMLDEFKTNELNLPSELRRKLIVGEKLADSESAQLNTYARNVESFGTNLSGWNNKDVQEWTRNFHANLPIYKAIYATDMWERSSLYNPAFHDYLRQQFRERNMRLSGKNRRMKCMFSREVYDAIIRTKWSTDLSCQCCCHETTRGGAPLELVRILIRLSNSDDDPVALRNLDYDHKQAFAPLFVIQRDLVEDGLASDYVVGIERNGSVLRGFECLGGCVKEIRSQEHKDELRENFLRLLASPHLKTVGEYLNNIHCMIGDNDKSRFIEKYEKYRGSDNNIMNELKLCLNISPGLSALDVGCGTGNYTIPFEKEPFLKLLGIDKSDDMLNVAKRRSHHIEWLLGDILTYDFKGATFDRVWGISMLHYFRGDIIRLFFKRIYDILSPGGIMVFDIEVKEQYPSLWVQDIFPSLQHKYDPVLRSITDYDEILKQCGFTSISFRHIDLDTRSKDAGLRMGQHDPTAYLDRGRLLSVPAFYSMDMSERDSGIAKIKKLIESGEIDDLMARREKEAFVRGDDTLIIAKKTAFA